MKLQDFVFDLPEESIAQYPAADRDGSRLLVLNRGNGQTEDRYFRDLPTYLRAGDVLVLNDSRVIKARLIGGKASTGAKIELFLLRRRTKEYDDVWEALARPAKRLKTGDRVVFETGQDGRADEHGSANWHGSADVHGSGSMDGHVAIAGASLTATILRKTPDGSVLLSFECAGNIADALDRFGHVPLPPYIRRQDEQIDAERYQTVYASEAGSAAAPTAGLHFTDSLLETVRAKGVETAFVTLHVGLGTFRPVQEADIENHKMHTEYFHIDAKAERAINAAKEDHRRVVCVGTTSVRVLESAACQGEDGCWRVKAGQGSTDIFLYPGCEFRMADALITNFHLPKSTLLMLVSAFCGRDEVLAAYRGAVEKGYRFFSYGDAMLIV